MMKENDVLKAQSLFLFLLFMVASLVPLSRQTQAYGEGFNSENFYPAIDNRSPILWESAYSVPQSSILYGYTMSYAFRPIELGDGENKRESISDHLQVNHLSIAYGIAPWLDVGINLPIALYSAPQNSGKYYSNLSRDRNFFFLGDTRIRAKVSFFPDAEFGFFAAMVAGLHAPTGNKAAMLTDDSTRLTLEFPLHYRPEGSPWEFYLTPGAALWGQKERIIRTDPITGNASVALEKAESLLINGGARYLLRQLSADGLLPGIQLEGGIRGDFTGFAPSLNERASPVEWSGGGAMLLSRALSVHGAFGTGLGSGAGAPMFRLVGGVRYVEDPAAEVPPESSEPPMLSSEAYSDRELEEIMKEAQGEAQAPSNANNEAMLRLLRNEEIIDIGVVKFEFDSARLTPAARETVRRLYEELVRLTPKSVRIEGHTDSVGSYNYNLALSKRRADSVKQELVRLGFNGSIVQTEGFSYKYPIASNGTPEGRAQNRRIEVSIDGQSFRKANPTPEEQAQWQRWIYPGGKKPRHKK